MILVRFRILEGGLVLGKGVCGKILVGDQGLKFWRFMDFRDFVKFLKLDFCYIIFSDYI